MASTLVYSITASLCNDNNLNSMIGYMELSFSIGLSVGPLFASFFYYLEGYAFTFIICGSLNFICLPFISTIKISDDKYESPEFLKIICNMVNILINNFRIILGSLYHFDCYYSRHGKFFFYISCFFKSFIHKIWNWSGNLVNFLCDSNVYLFYYDTVLKQSKQSQHEAINHNWSLCKCFFSAPSGTCTIPTTKHIGYYHWTESFGSFRRMHYGAKPNRLNGYA